MGWSVGACTRRPGVISFMHKGGGGEGEGEGGVIGYGLGVGFVLGV